MNTFSYVALMLACLFQVYQTTHVKLPKGFIACKYSSPDFDDCVKKATNLAIPELAKGVPKFGLPPIEPLVISALHIDQGTGPVSIKLNFTDLSIIGISHCEVKNIKVDVPNHKSVVNVESAQPILLDGMYSIAGKVLVLPITGNGHSRFTLSGFKASADITYQLLEKDGDAYWHIDKFDFNFSVTKLHMAMENLFNGNKELGDNMNLFLNENWQEILKELKPAFRSALGTAFSELIERFHSRVPLVQVFPKD